LKRAEYLSFVNVLWLVSGFSSPSSSTGASKLLCQRVT